MNKGYKKLNLLNYINTNIMNNTTYRLIRIIKVRSITSNKIANHIR